MNPNEQQFDPDAAGAPSAAAEGLGAISADRSGHVHWRCLRCGKYEPELVKDVRASLLKLAEDGYPPQLHDCFDGSLGLLELVGGRLNPEARNREALERMEKK